MTRAVILHYHLFKNAGTSLDRILKQNFGDAWVTREFQMKGNNTAEVERWITEMPDAIAFSSHTMIGPLPHVEGAKIIPVILLREPLDRIQSAYKFERHQVAETLGAKLAKEHDFEGYVRTRLAIAGDAQCRNFHATRLASFVPDGRSLFERAFAGLQLLQRSGIVGTVENFDAALSALSDKLRSHFSDFTWETTRANSSSGRVVISNELRRLLETTNAQDIALWNFVSASE